LLWLAYGISAIGDHLSELALLRECGGMGRGDTTRVQALMQFGFFLPFVVIGPFAGWWADRFTRKWTMFASDLFRAVLMLSLVWLVPAMHDAGFGDATAVIPLAAAGFFAAFFSPARQALLPTLIRTDQLVRANAMISALGTIGTILSAVLAGMIVKHLGTNWNYSLDSLTFFVSAVLVAAIAMSRARTVPEHRPVGVLLPLRDGFRYVRTHRRVLQLILLGTVFWAAAGSVTSMIPALVRDVFGGDIQDAGIYRGLVGIGLAIGAALMTLFGSAVSIPLAVLATVFGGAFWVFALALTVLFKVGAIPAGICLFMIGFHGSGLLITIMASIQRFVPNAKRGRVFGVSDMFTMGAMVAASGALGLPNIPNLDRYIPGILVVTGLGLFVAGVIAWRIYRRNETYGPFVEFVRRVGVFIARFWWRMERIGPCTIPPQGPVIVAANHASGIDPLLIIAASPNRTPAFLVERKYMNVPIAGAIMRGIDCIPVDRENPESSALKRVFEKLDAGDCIGIFPQGRLQKPEEDGVEPRAGIGMIALRAQCPVIPVHIAGTKYTKSMLAAFFLVRHRARVRFGPPVALSDLYDRGRDRDVQEAAAARVMLAIQELGDMASK
ncbi:MAG: MFS transporter, partial [Phycisphaerae bacterium]